MGFSLPFSLVLDPVSIFLFVAWLLLTNVEYLEVDGG